jgi:hypothetical protein
MRIITFSLFITACLSFGCTVSREESRDNASDAKIRTENSIADPGSAAEPGGEGGGSTKPLGSEAARKLCWETEVGDNDILRSQTFAIDFEPFRDSCFVTSHNPEYDDPPMESEIAIYNDGKRVFDFPMQFNGTAFGCWVEAVGFQDLNDDGLFDIIVAGKCSGRAKAYQENVVYVNTGKEFTTDEEANLKLVEKTTIKDIAAFVRANRKYFFK